MGTLVQSRGAATGYEAASDASASLAYSSNVVSGNLLVVTIGAYHDTATISTVADSGGRVPTWLQAGTLLRGTAAGGADVMLAVYYGIATSGGATTVNVTFSTAVTDKQLTIWEISGVNPTTPLNQTNGQAGNSVVSATGTPSGPITTTAPGFIIKVLQEWNWVAHDQASGTPTTGWTEFSDTATGSDSAYRNETGTGTFEGSFNLSGTVCPYACRIVAFADASGVPAPIYVFPPWIKV